MTRPYSLIGYQLTRPFAYLQVKHEDKKLYDWVIPTMLSAASLVFLYFFSDLNRVAGSDGLLASLAGFIGNLPGFFIAALAAIATFNRKDIDQLVSGVPPQVKVLQGNHLIEIPLTRRRFLCLLFAFLTAESITLTLYAHFGLAASPPFTGEAAVIAIWCYIAIYLFLLWQMIVATLFGLYYLGDRLHHGSVPVDSLKHD